MLSIRPHNNTLFLSLVVRGSHILSTDNLKDGLYLSQMLIMLVAKK